MFMRNNRRRNGAEQPEAVERADAREQREQDVLIPNQRLSAPQRRNFRPNLGSLRAISRRHMRGGLDDRPYPDYERKVPVGPRMP